jgi:hypothetical protein
MLKVVVARLVPAIASRVVPATKMIVRSATWDMAGQAWSEVEHARRAPVDIHGNPEGAMLWQKALHLAQVFSKVPNGFALQDLLIFTPVTLSWAVARRQIRLRVTEFAVTQIRIRTEMPTTSVQLDTPQQIISHGTVQAAARSQHLQVLPARP